MNILDELKNRMMFKDITNEKKFSLLKKGEGVYIGFDPTADSLHLGNYIQIATLIRFKQYGFNAIAVLGGATGMIGDPSGKSTERVLQSKVQLEKNKNKIRKQLESFGLTVVDNFEFYKNMPILDFLRDYGKFLNINYMMGKEVVSSRIESGMSFTEFSYQLIQGIDFMFLYEKHGVRIQVGGSDQWGNITAGTEIIRKTFGDENKAVGITTKLLLTASGKKFGKSEGNAIWIDKNKTSAFALYQYILNTPDSDLLQIFNWLTFLSTDEINIILNKHNLDPKSGLGQKKLAQLITKDIHGEKEMISAMEITDALFGVGDISKLTNEQRKSLNGSIPTSHVDSNDIQNIIVESSIAKSKRVARELIDAGSIRVNGEKIKDPDKKISKGYNIFKKGKRNYFLVIK